MSFSDRLQHAWNAFLGRDPTRHIESYYGGSSYREDRHVYSPTTERTQVSTIYNRIALDVAANNILHVQTDEEGNFKFVIKDGLNECLTLSANIDQVSRDFIKDIVYSMCEEGAVAILPVDTNINPETGSFDIQTMRTGEILEWYPYHVRVKAYNEKTGRKEEIIVPKSVCAIINNSFLDSVYGMLIVGSKYGIAYADGTERIIQLNRAVENNLYEQVKDLKAELYTELGITEGILNGTATEQELLNYQQHTIKPILEVICLEMKRKFLSKNARTRGQSVMYFNNPFGIVPVSQIAEIADKFTRNAIMSSNEFRSVIGYKPVDDPRADELSNKNINQPEGEVPMSTNEEFGAEGAQEENTEPRMF